MHSAIKFAENESLKPKVIFALIHHLILKDIIIQVKERLDYPTKFPMKKKDEFIRIEIRKEMEVAKNCVALLQNITLFIQ
jgi:hypothetical protein